METRETYKKAVEMAETYRNMVELYDRLIGAGIPKKMVQWFKFPNVSSGYSMGERVTIAVNGVDIVKRILRTKQGDSRRLDYEKIIHICEERIRQIDMED